MFAESPSNISPNPLEVISEVSEPYTNLGTLQQPLWRVLNNVMKRKEEED